MALDRRTFLRTLGAGILSSRLLDAPRAWAQTEHARRFIVVYMPDGVHPPAWRPLEQGTRYRFPAGGMLAPLERWREQLTVVSGLSVEGQVSHDKGMLYMLTNSGQDAAPGSVTGGRSVDQYIADAISADRPFRSLELGVQCSVHLAASIQTRMCYRGPSQWLSPNEHPHDVHRRLFPPVPEDELRIAARRRSALDLVRAETAALGARLTPSEQKKLDVHLDALRDVERSLEPRALADRCAVVPDDLQLDATANDNFPAISRAQIDLMVAALACDLTRVASLQYSYAASETFFSWLGASESHHSLSHMGDGNPAGIAEYVRDGQWFAEEFGYLLERLAALPEPGAAGSMLDHTVVLWTTEIADGLTHFCDDMPFVVAGGGSGRLRPGRHLRYLETSHSKLLTSLCGAFGPAPSSFGRPETGAGGLDGFLA